MGALVEEEGGSGDDDDEHDENTGGKGQKAAQPGRGGPSSHSSQQQGAGALGPSPFGAAPSDHHLLNFAKASVALDASVKIYSCRVDDVYSTSYRYAGAGVGAGELAARCATKICWIMMADTILARACVLRTPRSH